MLRISSLLLATAFLAIMSPAPAAAETATPQAIVQEMVDHLNRAVNGHQAELRHDPDRMDQVIDEAVMPHFAINFTSLLVLGSHAATATPAQQLAFRRAFRHALTRSFAKGLIDFTQVSIKVLPASAAPDQRRALVRTQVLQKDGSTVAVDYAFRKNEAGQWQAYDVIIEGISYITLYRSQVNAQIQKAGIDGVIKSLQTKGLIDVGQ